MSMDITYPANATPAQQFRAKINRVRWLGGDVLPFMWQKLPLLNGARLGVEYMWLGGCE